MKNKHISELSDMVKTLLDEQRALKQKVEMYENKMKSAVEGNSSIGVESSMLVRKQQKEITKKASERTRSQNQQKKTV